MANESIKQSPSDSRRGADDFLRRVKDSTSIVNVVGEHVVLRKSGANYSGLCPFHSERSPSFSVNEAKGVYFCHGCKAGGDVVSFVMHAHALDFVSAVRELAERASVPIPPEWRSRGARSEGEENLAEKKKALAYRLNRFAALYFKKALNTHPIARDYLASRGISEELLTTFYVGSVPSQMDGLYLALKQAQAPIEVAEELGLVRTTSARPFDLFRNRIVFPIIDLRGRVVGFGGRWIPGGETIKEDGYQPPKYLNSSESALFQKSRVLYGIHVARKHMRETGDAIIVEGYFDVLAMHAAGFGSAVATCGTALTREHLSILRRISERVIVLFDSDSAGTQATERALELGLSEGILIYGAKLPFGKDPHDCLFEGARVNADRVEQLKSALADAKPLLDLAIDRELEVWTHSAQDPERQTQAVRRMGEWLTRYGDPVGIRVRVERLIGLGVPGEILRLARGAQEPTAVRSPTRKSPAKAKPQPTTLPSRDRLLLRGLMDWAQFAPVIQDLAQFIPPDLQIADLFLHPEAKSFTGLSVPRADTFDEVLGFISRGEVRFAPTPEHAQVASIIAEAEIGDLGSGARITEAELKLALTRALREQWVRISQGLRSAIAEAEGRRDSQEENRLKQEYLEVERRKNALTIAEA